MLGKLSLAAPQLCRKTLGKSKHARRADFAERKWRSCGNIRRRLQTSRLSSDTNTMQQQFVSNLMRECSFAVVPESAKLRDAAELLVTHNYSVLVAEDESGKMCGVVPESAVIRGLMSNSNREATVGCILSRHVESVRAEAELTSVLHLFRSSCNSVIPAVNTDGQVVGLLHRRDVVRMLLSDAPADAKIDPAEDSAIGRPKPHFMDRRRSGVDAKNESSQADEYREE